MHARLADKFSESENKYPNPISCEEILESFANFKYIVPQGSPMSAIGNDFKVQSASNCFVIAAPEDSMGGIHRTDEELAQLEKRRAGVGTDISKKRPKDICLNIGIAGNASSGTDFYIMDNPALNTFSLFEATALEESKLGKIKRLISVPLNTVENVIDEYFIGKSPVFVNLDVEGLDEEILKTFPFNNYRPAIFCIETVHYTSDASSTKRKEIFDLMEEQGYISFADTYLNSIFIDARKFI